MSLVFLALLAFVFSCSSDSKSDEIAEVQVKVLNENPKPDTQLPDAKIENPPAYANGLQKVPENKGASGDSVPARSINDRIIPQEASDSGKLKKPNEDFQNQNDTAANAVMKPYEKEGFYKNARAQIRGKHLPIMVQGYSDPAIGLSAPEIKASTLAGSEIFIGGEGPTTLIMVLAHWCPHCRNEVRELSEFLAESDAMDRVRMITLLTSINEERANFPPHTWLEMEKWPLTSMVDTPSNQIATALGVSSFPFFIVLDDKGEIALRIPGRLGLESLTRLLEAIGDMGEEN